MKPNTATKEVTSRQFFLVVILLTFGACGAAVAQLSGVATGSVGVTAHVVAVTDGMRTNASLDSSILQELENPSAKGAWGSVSDGFSIALLDPTLAGTGTSIHRSDVLGFKVEEVYCDRARGIVAILGSDGNLYLHTPSSDDIDLSDWGRVEKDASTLVIVSVVD